MLKRIAQAFMPDDKAAFEGYYQQLLAGSPQTAPSADEARRAFQDSLRLTMSGLL